MKINVKRVNEAFHMEASNENGAKIAMDSSPDLGGENNGLTPMQLLLAAVGGCSSIDILLILKKQKQSLLSFEVEVDAEKEKVEEHSLFRQIDLHFKFTGSVDPAKAHRAVQLSLQKYCSVAKTLEYTATIGFRISIRPDLDSGWTTFGSSPGPV